MIRLTAGQLVLMLWASRFGVAYVKGLNVEAMKDLTEIVELGLAIATWTPSALECCLTETGHARVAQALGDTQ